MQARPKWAIALLAASVIRLAVAGQGQSTDNFKLVPTIAFASTRDAPNCTPPLASLEIYLMGPSATDPMSPDPANVQRMTDSEGCAHADNFPALSPDGKKIVFDSNRLTTNSTCGSLTGLLNISDLFLMGSDGSELAPLTRGSSAAWSPDSKYVAFHASASYYASGGSSTGCPIRFDPGAPTSDSDIFVANVDDLLAGVATPTNITNNADTIDEDADWSPVLPDGTTKITFTRHSVNYPFCSNTGTCNYPDTEIYVMNADGTGLTRLTHDTYEERAPAWSPDGSHIAFMCRIGPNNNQGVATFEICVMDSSGDGADNTSLLTTCSGPHCRQLTLNRVLDATPSWSPDGKKIALHRNPMPLQLWIINADGSGGEVQLTDPGPQGDVNNGFPHWGELRVHITK
jgi:Tol biopolymer transport system component